jgi:hypothetical protein
MLYAGLDIHKAVFQVVVLDPDSGELCESRFEPSRERLGDWAMERQGKLAAVAIEATTGWRWVARELEARGFVVAVKRPRTAAGVEPRGGVVRACGCDQPQGRNRVHEPSGRRTTSVGTWPSRPSCRRSLRAS